MSIAEDQAELTLIRATITKILTGGVMSRSTENKSQTMLNLDQLYARESVLVSRIGQASSGSFALARFRETP
jgi:hypothetical protein